MTIPKTKASDLAEIEPVEQLECTHPQKYEFFLENMTGSVKLTSTRCLVCKAWLGDTMNANTNSLGFKNLLFFLNVMEYPDEVKEHFQALIYSKVGQESIE